MLQRIIAKARPLASQRAIPALANARALSLRGFTANTTNFRKQDSDNENDADELPELPLDKTHIVQQIKNTRATLDSTILALCHRAGISVPHNISNAQLLELLEAHKQKLEMENAKLEAEVNKLEQGIRDMVGDGRRVERPARLDDDEEEDVIAEATETIPEMAQQTKSADIPATPSTTPNAGTKCMRFPTAGSTPAAVGARTTATTAAAAATTTTASTATTASATTAATTATTATTTTTAATTPTTEHGLHDVELMLGEEPVKEDPIPISRVRSYTDPVPINKPVLQGMGGGSWANHPMTDMDSDEKGSQNQHQYENPNNTDHASHTNTNEQSAMDWLSKLPPKTLLAYAWSTFFIAAGLVYTATKMFPQNQNSTTTANQNRLSKEEVEAQLAQLGLSAPKPKKN